MAGLPIKPLDGAGGYLRWKESLLLRARTLGVAHVLFEARPTGDDDDEAATKKWARDDVLCRGHILATLSDRLLPDYARFATAGELWRALERTYDVDEPSVWQDKFYGFHFDRSTGDVFLEQIAHAEALGAAAGLSDREVASGLRTKLPLVVRTGIIQDSNRNKKEMELVWEVARRIVSIGVDPEHLWGLTQPMTDDEDGFYVHGLMPEQNMAACRKRGGMSGQVARNSRRRA